MAHGIQLDASFETQLYANIVIKIALEEAAAPFALVMVNINNSRSSTGQMETLN